MSQCIFASGLIGSSHVGVEGDALVVGIDVMQPVLRPFSSVHCATAVEQLRPCRPYMRDDCLLRVKFHVGRSVRISVLQERNTVRHGTDHVLLRETQQQEIT